MMHRGQRKKAASRKLATWHPKISQRKSRKTVAALLKRQSSWAWHSLLVA
jgi:hypothetical protein